MSMICKEQAVKVANLATVLLEKELIGNYIEDEMIVELDRLDKVLEGISISNSIDTDVRDALLFVISRLNEEKSKLERIKKRSR